MVKPSQKKLQNMTINLPGYIFSAHTLVHLAFLFIQYERKKYEKKIQTSVDNKVNDLRYEMK